MSSEKRVVTIYGYGLYIVMKGDEPLVIEDGVHMFDDREAAQRAANKANEEKGE